MQQCWTINRAQTTCTDLITQLYYRLKQHKLQFARLNTFACKIPDVDVDKLF